MKWKVYLMIVFLKLLTASCEDVETVALNGRSSAREDSPSFTIDYNNATFLMNGSPFQFIAGSLHYFRVPHQYWRDRLRAFRAAGLNTVTTYVEWSFHEPERGQYDWTGDKDLVQFIEIAREEDLYVILRPGPYICAERDMGGLPYWLLHYYPEIQLRTNDEDYKAEITIWYSQLMSRMRPFLFGKGGPIIMVQVENEYGSYPACDHEYMAWLAALTRMWVEDDALLFTTDGPSKQMLECGSTPDVYPTVDFGAGTNVTYAWDLMREYAGNGPGVNSEYYPGWLTHWGENIARSSTEGITSALKTMLDVKGNVNFYVFYGGTNFEYTSGGNLYESYTPQITSYDYDAPLTEAGDPTSKYFAIAETISNYFSMPAISFPSVKPKWYSNALFLQPVLHLLSDEGRQRLGRNPSFWINPPTMEAVLQRCGLILYETDITSSRPDPSALNINDLKDRALIYMEHEYTGVLSRTRHLNTLPISADQGNNLQILVENQGRVNYGSGNKDFKGIVGNVTLEDKSVENWRVTSFPLETIESNLTGISKNNQFLTRPLRTTRGLLRNGPVVYTVKFQLTGDDLLDSYLDVTGWGKGYAWVNDRHLGRYWPKEGPQVTLYTPGVYFKKYPEWNTLTILELQSTPESLVMKFINSPIGV